MSTMTRQDLLSVTEIAKNKIIERLVTKYEVQAACDNARDRILSSIQAMQLENQALIRQANAQKDQSWRKIAAMENQIAGLRQDIKAIRELLQELADDSSRLAQSSDFSAPFPVK